MVTVAFLILCLGVLCHVTDNLYASPNYRIAVVSDLNGSYGSSQYSADVTSAINQLMNGYLEDHSWLTISKWT